MRVAIIGGTGFVGSYITDELLEAGHVPVLLVRPGSEHRVTDQERCERVTGDLEAEEALRRLLEGSDAVIYNVGILREFPQRGITFDRLQRTGAVRVIDMALKEGPRRFLLMSANGTRADGTPYQRSKFAAEEHLTSSDLDWTVFRPSVIFGDPRGRSEFASQLKAQIIDPPLPAPLFFSGLDPRQAGEFALSPVHVQDVASAFVGSLERRETFGRSYTLGGPQDLSWKEILSVIAESAGTHKLMLPAPAWIPQLTAGFLEGFSWFPVTRDQIRMLLEGNTCSGDEIFGLLGIEPHPFTPETLTYLRPH
jgi:NADH dehydrogenase